MAKSQRSDSGYPMVVMHIRAKTQELCTSIATKHLVSIHFSGFHVCGLCPKIAKTDMAVMNGCFGYGLQVQLPFRCPPFPMISLSHEKVGGHIICSCHPAATNHMWEARIKMHKELTIKSVLIWGGPCQRKGPVQHRSPAWNSRCLNNAPQQISQTMIGCIRFQPLSRVPAATHPLVGRRAVQVPPCKVGTDWGVSNASNRLGPNIDATTSCTTCKHAKHLLRVQPQKFNAHNE